MSGYRGRSSFDPNAGGDYGRPLRPFNKWQWAGVAFDVVGVAILLAAMAGNMGWISGTKDLFPAGMSFAALGTLLINSRRETLTPEQTARQRRRGLVAIAVALAACAIGLTVIIYSKGV